MSLGQFINKKFLLYAFGIFFCYSYYGILQEKITRAKYGVKKEVFTYSMSLVFVQCIVNTLFALVQIFVVNRRSEGSTRDSTTHFFYGCSALSYLTAMVSSNRALQHVSYPTQVIAKSCKPIPVMIVGVLYARKRYSLLKYFFVFLIVLGVGVFMYNPGKISSVPNAQSAAFVGELLLLLSLTCDGFTGAFQDRMKSDHGTKPGHMMLWMNAWSTLILAVALTLTGELWQFVDFVQRFPFVVSFILQFSAMSAIGQLFIFLTISSFGPLVCSLITTTRKFFTVLFSVLLFGNSLSGQQWLGTTLVFLGLSLDMFFGKQPPKKSPLL